jgi:hypothetical protein
MNDHVFICYSRKDEDFVLKLAENLKKKGVPIWLDQLNIPFGANWNRSIEKALQESTRLLLVLSPSSVASDEVESEWRSALEEDHVVIPILYQPCRIPSRLRLIQYIDFTSRSPDDKESLELILDALEGGGNPIEPEAQPEQTQVRPITEDAKANIESNIGETRTSIKSESGLRIQRLKALRFVGIILLIAFCLIYPMVINFSTYPRFNASIQGSIATQGFIGNEPSSAISFAQAIIPWMPVITIWIIAISIGIIGGIGGLLSGLLLTRSSKTNLELYEESVLLFQLRPIFGAFAALVTTMLLSWMSEIIPIHSSSSLAAFAFLSGFSERYFLSTIEYWILSIPE